MGPSITLCKALPGLHCYRSIVVYIVLTICDSSRVNKSSTVCMFTVVRGVGPPTAISDGPSATYLSVETPAYRGRTACRPTVSFGGRMDYEVLDVCELVGTVASSLCPNMTTWPGLMDLWCVCVRFSVTFNVYFVSSVFFCFVLMCLFVSFAVFIYC